MTHELNLNEIKKEWHGTLKAYSYGFLGCLILTIISFSLVITRPFSETILIYTIIALAIMQAIVQLLFFLHIGQEESKPRWESIVFCFTLLILIIIVIGSLWIMHDLNHRMMPDMNP